MHPPGMPVSLGRHHASGVPLSHRTIKDPKALRFGLQRASRATANALFMGLLLVCLVLLNKAVAATTLPAGFQEVTFASGLIQPTALRFATDGRIFVAEKRGVVKVFNNLSDTNPKTLVDIRTDAYNFWDRGSQDLRTPSDPVTLDDAILRVDRGRVAMPKSTRESLAKPACPSHRSASRENGTPL